MVKKSLKVTTEVPPLENLDPEDNLLGMYDPTNPDINLFNLVDDEIIKLGGSKILYYKYMRGNQYDEVYMEDRTKVLSKEPIVLYAHYDPKIVEEALSQFGLEVVNDQIFTFNKSYAERKIGRPPHPGDVIKPFFQNMRFSVFEVNEDSFQVYGVYHYRCMAKLLKDHEELADPNRDVDLDNIGQFLDGDSRPDIG